MFSVVIPPQSRVRRIDRNMDRSFLDTDYVTVTVRGAIIRLTTYALDLSQFSAKY